MDIRDIERHAQILARQFDLASTSRRRELRSEVKQIIHKLKSRNHPVPRPLTRIEAAISADDFDDLFENMPI